MEPLLKSEARVKKRDARGPPRAGYRGKISLPRKGYNYTNKVSSMVENAEEPVAELSRDNRSLREGFAAKGICSGCGACVTVCQILGNKVLRYNQKSSSLDLEISSEECRHCGLCYAVC